MTTYLLAISFLLHLITLLMLFVIFQRRTLERANLPSMKEDVETIHQSIQAFVDELEKENEALYEKMLEHIKIKEKNWEARITIIEKELQLIEQIPTDTETKPEINVDPYVGHSISDVETAQVVAEEQENSTNSSNYQKAMDLYYQGFSAEQIARLLQIGKGEAELIINMINKQRDMKTEK